MLDGARLHSPDDDDDATASRVVPCRAATA
jgi:hypothetical protein